MPETWRALSLDEALAVEAELAKLREIHGSDHRVADLLGCSQQVVHMARAKGRPGRLVANALYAFMGVSREILLAKYREKHAHLTASPEKASDLDLPPDPFPARTIAARRASVSTQWRITPSAIRRVCTAPEWQSPLFANRDAVFWVEVMKLETMEEERTTPKTEEERLFRDALRSLNDAKGAAQTNDGAAAAPKAASARRPSAPKRATR